MTGVRWFLRSFGIYLVACSLALGVAAYGVVQSDGYRTTYGRRGAVPVSIFETEYAQGFYYMIAGFSGLVANVAVLYARELRHGDVVVEDEPLEEPEPEDEVLQHLGDLQW